jgi:hypothetical protein
MDISAGVDGSVWGLGCDATGTDYPILKWNPLAKKWYTISGLAGITLSAYNEISVAVV